MSRERYQYTTEEMYRGNKFLITSDGTSDSEQALGQFISLRLELELLSKQNQQLQEELQSLKKANSELKEANSELLSKLEILEKIPASSGESEVLDVNNHSTEIDLSKTYIGIPVSLDTRGFDNYKPEAVLENRNSVNAKIPASSAPDSSDDRGEAGEDTVRLCDIAEMIGRMNFSIEYDSE